MIRVIRDFVCLEIDFIRRLVFTALRKCSTFFLLSLSLHLISTVDKKKAKIPVFSQKKKKTCCLMSFVLYTTFSLFRIGLLLTGLYISFFSLSIHGLCSLLLLEKKNDLGHSRIENKKKRRKESTWWSSDMLDRC